jgi:hypothetical protein
VLNRGWTESQLDQLPVCYQTMLPVRDLGDIAVSWSNLWAYIAQIFDHLSHWPKDRFQMRPRERWVQRKDPASAGTSTGDFLKGSKAKSSAA